jgi:hypothetical protein
MLIEWGLKEKMILRKLDVSSKDKYKQNGYNELNTTKRNNKIRNQDKNQKNTNLSIIIKLTPKIFN